MTSLSAAKVYFVSLTRKNLRINKGRVKHGKNWVKDLTEADEQKLNDIISSKYSVEGDLKRLVTNNIKRIKDINSYKGLRHKAGLPVNGQRTRTNARTRKGKAIAVGGAQPKAASKT